MITVKDLYGKKACRDGIALFCASEMHKVDFSTVESVTVHHHTSVEYLHWLVGAFKLGITINCKTSDGYYIGYEYDHNGNMLSCKTSDGYLEEYEYDHNGNITDFKTSEKFSKEQLAFEITST